MSEVKRSIDGYIDKSELAARLGKTKRTIESWMRQGWLPFLKIGSGRRATVLFSWAQITATLAARFGKNSP